MSSFHPLDIAIIGSGLGGLCAAIALRRSGHHCTLYDRSDFVDEVGAGIGIVSNGTRLLEKVWGVDLTDVKPVVIQRLVMRDWKTGKIAGEAPTGDFKKKFGSDYYGCVRVDLHDQLKKEATQRDGPGRAALLKTGWRCTGVNEVQGEATFENGEKVTADLIIGADGVNVGVMKSFYSSCAH
jgi:salicylate hydroxylase